MGHINMQREEFIRLRKKHDRITKLAAITIGLISIYLSLHARYIRIFLYQFLYQLFPNFDSKPFLNLIVLSLVVLVFLLFFVILRFSNKRLGLLCKSCGSSLYNDSSSQIVISTKNCGHCGKQVLDD